MAITLDMLTRGAVLKPPRMLTYGPHGIGKTSLACSIPNSILLMTEDGVGLLDIPRFPLLTCYDDLVAALDLLGTNPNLGVRNVVLDTLDAAEPLIWAEACRRNGWANVEDGGYGKGYVAALDVWREMLARFDALRDFCGMSICYIAHAKVTKYEAPDSEAFDRYSIKLQDGKATSASALLQEHVDCVFFNNWRTSIARDPTKGGKKAEPGRARGVGGGTRVLYTEERPPFLAKNRFSMPEAIDIPDDPAVAWASVAKHIPFFNQTPAPAAVAA